MALIKCTECGKEISDKAKTCPSCGAPVVTPKTKATKALSGCLGIIIVLSLALIVLLAIVGKSSSGDAATAPATAPAKASSSATATARPVTPPKKPVVTVPPQQALFGKIVGAYAERYSALENELQKSAARVERRAEMQKAFPSKTVSGWVGTLEKMGTTSDGLAYIEVRLTGSNAVLKTSNNEFSEALLGKTLIAPTSTLYAVLSSLPKNATVVFSGSFFPDGQRRDHMSEGSLTENGAMTEPEFFFRFDDVKLWEPEKAELAKAPNEKP
jgi:hypothetical protein